MELKSGRNIPTHDASNWRSAIVCPNEILYLSHLVSTRIKLTLGNVAPKLPFEICTLIKLGYGKDGKLYGIRRRKKHSDTRRIQTHDASN